MAADRCSVGVRGKRLWSRLPVAVGRSVVWCCSSSLEGRHIAAARYGLAAIVAVASLAPLWGRNLRRTPLPTWGMVTAHFGVAVALAGMGAESAFIKERLVAAAPGDVIKVGGYAVTFVGVRPVAGPNYTSIEGTLVARTAGGGAFTMRPEARTFPGLMGTAPVETNRRLLTRPGGQLYAVLGQPVASDDGADDTRSALWKPLVWWIWLGGGLIALGAALSLWARSCRASGGAIATRSALDQTLGSFVPLAIMGLLFGAHLPAGDPRRNADPVAMDRQADALFDLPPATAGVEVKSASWPTASRAGQRVRQLVHSVPRPVRRPRGADRRIAIRDRPEDVATFLREYGNPFDRIGSDMQSSVQIVGRRRPRNLPDRRQGHYPRAASGHHSGRAEPEIIAAGGDEVSRTRLLSSRGRACFLAALLLALGATVGAPSFAQNRLPPAPYAYEQLKDPVKEARAKALMDELRCLVCQGQSIADSDAPLAGDMRHEVRSKIAAGGDAIKQWLVARYGN